MNLPKREELSLRVVFYRSRINTPDYKELSGPDKDQNFLKTQTNSNLFYLRPGGPLVPPMDVKVSLKLWTTVIFERSLALPKASMAGLAATI